MVPNCVVVMPPSSRCQFAVMVNCIFASSSIRQPNIAQPTPSTGPQVFAGLDLTAIDTHARYIVSRAQEGEIWNVPSKAVIKTRTPSGKNSAEVIALPSVNI